MGKNKFINRKKSATFQLFARDSSDPNYSSPTGGDHVFVRVDNNPISVKAFTEDQQPSNGDDDSNDIFADAPGDYDVDEDTTWYQSFENSNQRKPLPDDVRREIIELGFPDDGYNYLIHMREIKNSGVGSMYYQNPKANYEQLKPDVKAYNASRVDISKVEVERDEKEIYDVASKAANARVEKVVDDEIAALLDDSDLSRFGSDIEDLEEDFVVMANLPERDLEVNNELPVLEKKSNDSKTVKSDLNISNVPLLATINDEKPRTKRLLDEQFESLLLQEYGTESDDDGYDGCDDRIEENEESLVEKLNNAFKFHSIDGLEKDMKGTVTSNILQPMGEYGMEPSEDAAAVIKRVKEYAEKYENESDDGKQVIFEESSDDSEKWDCETIVSTHSNLDNLPGIIGAPETNRKKKLVERFSGARSSGNKVISLGGKEKLPVDFLPNAQSHSANKVKEEKVLKPELKRKQHGQESKVEKKERKAAVKEEKREARKAKKEMKELYKGEAQIAQRVAASTGPSSIHLM